MPAWTDWPPSTRPRRPHGPRSSSWTAPPPARAGTRRGAPISSPRCGPATPWSRWCAISRTRRFPRPAPGPRVLAVRLRAHAEREIVALAPEEREAFRAELGVEEDGLTLVIRACYELLGLISFFTVGPDEVRAWTVRRGEHAVDAAA